MIKIIEIIVCCIIQNNVYIIDINKFMNELTSLLKHYVHQSFFDKNKYL